MTTVGTFLQRATAKLAAADIETARLDCLVLLEDALHQERATILAHPEAKISAKTEVKLNKKIAQRTEHMPLAYIRGKAPFYGREFAVNRRVLVPRPETEGMISIFKRLHLPAGSRIADVGTGSGCLGITAALEIPTAEVHLYDIDKHALAVARHNAHAYDIKARCYQADLFGRYFGPYDVVLANLPYVPAGHGINKAAKHEPETAIFAGDDGLDAYLRFWQQLGALDEKPLFVLTEALSFQHDALTELAKAAGYRLVLADGLTQQFTPP